MTDRRITPKGPAILGEDRLLARPPGSRRLIAGRVGAGLTQAQAAAACGITAQHISDIECGRSRPSPVLLRRLADVYGIEDVA